MKRAVIFIVITVFLLSLISATITSKSTENDDADEETQTNLKKEAFCGTSTYASCESDEDCIAAGCSNSVCQGVSEEPSVTICDYKECYNAETYNADCICKRNKCMWNKLTQNQVQNIIKAKNRIRASISASECPANCTCTGSVTKCQLQKGEREMTIVAGKSGNIIVQVKNVNASTKVTLYKNDDGKVYGVFKNNETKEIKLLPDQVRERIREKLSQELEDEEIELDEEGKYQYQAKKKAKLFGFIKVKQKIRAELGAENGELIRLRKPWWAFLATDDGELIVGASCGTVAPDSRDECCQNEDYDFWNAETAECEFNE